MLDDVPNTDSEPLTLTQFYQRNGVAWGAVDLIALGRGRSVSLLGEVAGLLRLLVLNGAPHVRETVVVLPPPQEEGAVDAVETALLKSVVAIKGSPLSDGEHDAVLRGLRVLFAESLDVSTLTARIRAAPEHTALLVGRAALYRTPGIEAADHSSYVPGDVWAPHLLALMQEAADAAEAARCYVVIEVGENLPGRRRQEPRPEPG